MAFTRKGLMAGRLRRVIAVLCAAIAALAFLAVGTRADAAVRGHKGAHTAGTPKVRRHGTLVLLGNGTAYDLDSLAANWSSSRGVAWVTQNVMYVPTGDHGKPILDIAFSPATDVLMGSRGPWTYRSCAKAHFDPSYVNNPNAAIGSALNPGHAICVITRSTKQPRKTDGGHFVLLVVKARTNTTLTLQVTVWQ